MLKRQSRFLLLPKIRDLLGQLRNSVWVCSSSSSCSSAISELQQYRRYHLFGVWHVGKSSSRDDVGWEGHNGKSFHSNGVIPYKDGGAKNSNYVIFSHLHTLTAAALRGFRACFINFHQDTILMNVNENNN